jgi:hypothetical protein
MNPAKPRPKKFKHMLEQIDKAVVFDKNTHVDKYDLAAICVHESWCTPVFCSCSKQDLDELNNVVCGAGVEGNSFLDAITISEGKLKGNRPRFRFDAFDFRRLQADSRLSGLTRVQRAFLSCHAGIAMQSMSEYAFEFKGGDVYEHCMRFAGDIPAQLIYLYLKISALDDACRGSRQLAFTRYRFGSRTNDIRNYGVQIYRFAQDLREVWEAQEGLAP